MARCLSAIGSQSRKVDIYVIVDNASTDGTREFLESHGWCGRQDVEVLFAQQNLGGAGGFSVGLQLALRRGADWIWMMDDDAKPHEDALAELMVVATEPSDIYGSLAVNGADTSWLMTITETSAFTTGVADQVPARAQVQMLPFLGFMIHRELVNRIGLPDPGFFIAADDVEYCVRAKKSGARIIVAGRSRIEHPKSRPYTIRLPGITLTGLALPPWKRYYDTRNRLLIARRHYGVRFFTQTIPGSLVRMMATLLTEADKYRQLKAFVAGFVDGLLGRTGKRHEAWGIDP